MSFPSEINPEVDVLEAIENEVDSSEIAQLIVYNDDHNSFDWVISTFVEVLGHSAEQSEQLALIIHLKGRAIVKTASYEELKPLKESLIERGLSAEIETERVDK